MKQKSSIEILEEIANLGISIDIINIFPDRIAFTVESKYKERVKSILDKQTEPYDTVEGCSKITCIGERIVIVFYS